MLFSAAHRPANCVLCAFFWYRSFFSPLVPSATRTRFERTRVLTVCLLLFILCLSSLLFGFSSWSFPSSFSLVPPILSPVEASCLFYSPYHRPLPSPFPFLAGSLPFGFYCGEFSPHLRWLGFPEIAISTTTLRNRVVLGLHVIYFYYHAARAALPFSFSLLRYYEAVTRYSSYLWLPMTATAAWNFDVSVERKFSIR